MWKLKLHYELLCRPIPWDGELWYKISWESDEKMLKESLGFISLWNETLYNKLTKLRKERVPRSQCCIKHFPCRELCWQFAIKTHCYPKQEATSFCEQYKTKVFDFRVHFFTYGTKHLLTSPVTHSTPDPKQFYHILYVEYNDVKGERTSANFPPGTIFSAIWEKNHKQLRHFMKRLISFHEILKCILMSEKVCLEF